MLCVGGADSLTKEVYWLNMEDRNCIYAAGYMRVARGWPGVIQAGNWIYAFGS